MRKHSASTHWVCKHDSLTNRWGQIRAKRRGAESNWWGDSRQRLKVSNTLCWLCLSFWLILVFPQAFAGFPIFFIVLFPSSFMIEKYPCFFSLLFIQCLFLFLFSLAHKNYLTFVSLFIPFSLFQTQTQSTSRQRAERTGKRPSHFNIPLSTCRLFLLC